MIENGVTSLKEFKRLETVELDVRVFAGPSVASGNRQGITSIFTGWEPSSVPSLIDMLPPTIRKVNLFVSDNEGEVDETQGATILSKLLEGEGKDYGHPMNLVVRSNRKDDELQEIRDIVDSCVLDRDSRWAKRFAQEQTPMWQELFTARCGEIFQ